MPYLLPYIIYLFLFYLYIVFPSKFPDAHYVPLHMIYLYLSCLYLYLLCNSHVQKYRMTFETVLTIKQWQDPKRIFDDKWKSAIADAKFLDIGIKRLSEKMSAVFVENQALLNKE